MTTRRQFLAALGSTALASALWVPNLSRLFAPRESTLQGDTADPIIRGLLEKQLRAWEGPPGSFTGMRVVNPEWDFMGRTFAGLAFLEAATADPGLRPRALRALDRLLESTVHTLHERGMHHYLMAYSRRAPFLNPQGSSLFIDGELLTLLAAREQVVGDGRYATLQEHLAQQVRANLDGSPIGHGESYPDECWAFCNGFAALGLQLDMRTSSRSHAAALNRHHTTTAALVEPETGMLQSEYTYAGRPMDGPEGSSIYLVTTLLKRTHPTLGAAQYALARTHLLRSFLGFGYSREWAGEGRMDVDSGPIVPFFQAGSAASGLAIQAARAYRDTEMLSKLLASLKATAFPTWEGDALHFAASNPVGDASILWGLIQGHLDLGTHA